MTGNNAQDGDNSAKNIAPAVYNDGPFDVLVDKDEDLEMAALTCIHCGRKIFTFSQLWWPTAILKMTCPDCNHITYYHMGAGVVCGRPLPPMPSNSDECIAPSIDSALEDKED